MLPDINTISLELGRVSTLLHRVGNPQNALPPVIHVAGTNGKGSVIAFLRAIYEAAGYKVHAYTSPHLIDLTERFYVSGRAITPVELDKILAEVQEAARDLPVTYFEITTVAAFLAFARTPADVLLLETGLGGRFDATNVIDRPAATVITPIGMDHTEFLGDTIESIAREKAGILRPNVMTIFGPQTLGAELTLIARAHRTGTPFMSFGSGWRIYNEGDSLAYADAEGEISGLPLPALVGPHQILNAGLAIATCRAVPGIPVTETDLAAGLKYVQWPGRFQKLTFGPLAGLLPEQWALYVDGAHNLLGGQALTKTVRALPPRPTHFIVGMRSNKPAEGFLQCIGQDAASLTAVPEQDDQFYTPSALAAIARSVGHDMDVKPSIREAIRSLCSGHDAPARIIVCGSLYLAGTALRESR